MILEDTTSEEVVSGRAEPSTPPAAARSPSSERADTRRTGRILAMQILCQMDVRGDEAVGDLETLARESGASDAAALYAAVVLEAFRRQRRQVDQRITAESGNWALERISIVERNVIRVAVSELLGAGVPAKVAINEAIEIGKVFGGAESPRFINGVLDAVYTRVKDDVGITNGD
ncbi:MAG: transcription antitermination factor NusB [Phycisphaerales bacterium]|nr:MAG: transcription antitermination factor NusB [Phycisphaerales bacterium]